MESQETLCEVCGKTFMHKRNVDRHLRECHNMNVNVKPAKDMNVNVKPGCSEIRESQRAICEICGKTYKLRKILYKHIRLCHERDVKLKADTEKCDMCGKMFSGLTALRRHRRIHYKVYGKVSCTECDDFMCRSMRDLRNHLEREHGVDITREVMEFDSMEYFLHWKRKMEGEKRVSFVKKGGVRFDKEKFKFYYFCHRSGNAKNSGLGLRLRRPSAKIGRTCPASLIVTDMPSGKVNVQFYATHTGHGFSLASLNLTPDDRAKVAELVASGLSDADILKTIREGAHENGLRRVHMLKRKDIYNIKKQYKLDSLLNKSEAGSVELQSSVVSSENLIAIDNSEAGSVDHQSSVVSSEILLATARGKCQVLSEMMENVGNENIAHYIESLDRLIQHASVTIASQKLNSTGKQEFIGPLHDHTYI